jgi:hypothetical protein
MFNVNRKREGDKAPSERMTYGAKKKTEKTRQMYGLALEN